MLVVALNVKPVQKATGNVRKEQQTEQKHVCAKNMNYWAPSRWPFALHENCIIKVLLNVNFFFKVCCFPDVVSWLIHNTFMHL